MYIYVHIWCIIYIYIYVHILIICLITFINSISTIIIIMRFRLSCLDRQPNISN